MTKKVNFSTRSQLIRGSLRYLVLTMQCIPDQSHCQLNSVAQGGGHGHTAHWD